MSKKKKPKPAKDVTGALQKLAEGSQEPGTIAQPTEKKTAKEILNDLAMHRNTSLLQIDNSIPQAI